jgi:hypothetical protein
MGSPKRSRIVAAALALLAAATVTAFLVGNRDPLRAPERRAWKDAAVATLNARRADSVSAELAQVRLATAATRRSSAWVGPDILLMKNGDWIAYRSICRKEDRRIHDLFVGRGSDGQWYYSTFHFCRGMAVLSMEDQPASLAEFVHAYSLAPFDGRSDDALKPTWEPSQPYGPWRLQAPDAGAGR